MNGARTHFSKGPNKALRVGIIKGLIRPDQVPLDPNGAAKGWEKQLMDTLPSDVVNASSAPKVFGSAGYPGMMPQPGGVPYGSHPPASADQGQDQSSPFGQQQQQQPSSEQTPTTTPAAASPFPPSTDQTPPGQEQQQCDQEQRGRGQQQGDPDQQEQQQGDGRVRRELHLHGGPHHLTRGSALGIRPEALGLRP